MTTVYQHRRFHVGTGRGKDYVVPPDPVPSASSQLSDYFRKIGYTSAAAMIESLEQEMQGLIEHHNKIAPFLPPNVGALAARSRALATAMAKPHTEGKGRRAGGGVPRTGRGASGTWAPGTEDEQPTQPGQEGERRDRPSAPAHAPTGEAAGPSDHAPAEEPQAGQVEGGEPRPEHAPGEQERQVGDDGAALPEAESELFAAIRAAEGTTDEKAKAAGFASGYDVPLGYGKYGRPAKPLTDMTLREAYDFGLQVRRSHGRSSALGAFQIVGRTMKDYMGEAGLGWDDKFSPENQRALAAVIAKKQGLGAWEGFKYNRSQLGRAKAAMKRGEAEAAISGRGGTFQGGGATGAWTGPAPGVSRVREMQGEVAAIRKGALAPQTKNWLEYAGSQTGLEAHVTSGGQRMPGAPGHTGSHRHDVGGAADLKLWDPAQKRYLDMRNPDDAARMKAYVGHAVHAGATGVGAGLGYMGAQTVHIGGGKAAHWGGAPWVGEARVAGERQRRAGVPLAAPPAPPEPSPAEKAEVARHNAKMTGAPTEEDEVARHNAKMTGAPLKEE